MFSWHRMSKDLGGWVGEVGGRFRRPFAKPNIKWGVILLLTPLCQKKLVLAKYLGYAIFRAIESQKVTWKWNTMVGRFRLFGIPFKFKAYFPFFVKRQAFSVSIIFTGAILMIFFFFKYATGWFSNCTADLIFNNDQCGVLVFWRVLVKVLEDELLWRWYDQLEI